jgi:hypothetical protein
MNKETPGLADMLREALPEELRESAEMKQALDRVTELEAARTDAELQRRFLERAPHEGLLYPGDALKLENVTRRLKQGDDPDAALREVYRDLRANRPYLFSKPPAPPEKLSQPLNDRLRESWNGAGLTRQLMLRRRQKQ